MKYLRKINFILFIPLNYFVILSIKYTGNVKIRTPNILIGAKNIDPIKSLNLF